MAKTVEDGRKTTQDHHHNNSLHRGSEAGAHCEYTICYTLQLEQCAMI